MKSMPELMLTVTQMDTKSWFPHTGRDLMMWEVYRMFPALINSLSSTKIVSITKSGPEQ